MKHLVKKLSTLFIVAVLAVTMLLPATANAQERTIKYKQNLVLSKENTFASNLLFPEKVKSCTSTNKNILNPDMVVLDEKSVAIYTNKAGKTELSFVGKSGKIYTINLTVVKYSNPVSKFKIDSKNYASKFKKSSMPALTSSGKQKISIKAKKGWKVVDLHYTFYNYSGKIKTKKFKNNRSVNISKKYSGFIDATLKNKKTNAITILTLCTGPQF